MKRDALLVKLEQHIESLDILGFDVGAGDQLIDFLARLEMDAVEQLLGSALSASEREQVLSWVEERKGQLIDSELPALDAQRRAEHRQRLKRMKRDR